MRRILSAPALLLGLVACQDVPLTSPPDPAGAPLQASLASSEAERVVPGEVIVKVREDAEPAQVAQAHGLAVAGRGYRGAFVVLRGAAGSERALAVRVASDPRVVYAEPNYLRQTTATPIDPKMWAFYNPGGLTMKYTRGPNSGKPVQSKISKADADEDAAPNGEYGSYAAGGASVVISSIDTGVDYNHTEFLSGQIIKGRDWYSGDDDPMDEDGHGTHTTGTMVGQTVGVAGVSGAGVNIKVYAQRVCGPMGCPLSAIANAINAAADVQGMVAMNLSLGGSSESQAEKDAIAYATSKGILVIASAGNDGKSTISCPACNVKAISVAATNWQDTLSYYSNWGEGLDLSAPGGEMYSNTTSEGGIYSAVPGGYAYYQGTSMAAPQVTGIAGIVASKTGLRGANLRARLESNVDDLGTTGYDTYFGNGRVNSYTATTGTTLTEGGTSGGGGTTLQASFTYSCSGTTCNFDGSGSTGESSYAWDFQTDGIVDAITATASHTYGQVATTYTVTLSVRDGSGATSSANKTISCSKKGKNWKCQ